MPARTGRALCQRLDRDTVEGRLDFECFWRKEVVVAAPRTAG
jgi:hypothetical protein